MLFNNVLVSIALTLASADASLVKKQYSQEATDMSNVLRHLGGIGPFVEPVGFGIPTSTPHQCVVDQAHLFMRHGERYPTKGTGKDLKKFVASLKERSELLSNSSMPVTGPLSFVDDVEYFVGDDKLLLDQETFTGPYAGLGDAYAVGNLLRQRYAHLVNASEPIPIFAAGQKRVVDTAKSFAEGFTFNGKMQNYTMVVLPEVQDSGLNSLTNTDSCVEYDGDYEGAAANMTLTYKQQEAARLNDLSPGFNITEKDVFSLINYCGFELDVAGSSPFCDAVSMDAIIGFSYEKDLYAYYGLGPGYDLNYASGSVYVNATAALLGQDSEDVGSLFFSFTHDSDVLRYLTALGLYDDDEPLPVDRIEFNKNFKVSDIIPMGARLITERLSCYNETSEVDDTYVRLILNDQVLPFGECTSGPGFSCPLEEYLDIVADRHVEFDAPCSKNTSTPDSLSFYWDWTDGKYPTSYDVK